MTDDSSENTQVKRVIGKPFQPGNPGKPKGVKHKLQEDFLRDVKEAWDKMGSVAIASMIDQKPHEFVKMVASLMPKEATLNINDHSEMTDAELAERIRQLGSAIAPFLAVGTGDTGEGGESASSAAIAARVH